MYVISIVIFSTMAFYEITYSPQVYKSVSTLLIKENKSSKGANDNLLSYFQAAQSYKNLINEIEVIKSKSTIKRTIESLDFEISYYVGGAIKKGEVYPTNSYPFEIKQDTTTESKQNIPIYIKYIDDNTYEIQLKEELPFYKTILYFSKYKILFTQKCTFGSKCITPFFSGVINKKEGFKQLKSDKIEHFFIINNKDYLVNYFSNNLSVTPPDAKGVSFMNLSITGENVAKNNVFLNQLCATYNLIGLEEKNENIDNTLKFIEDQLFGITDFTRS